jgi:hypothetical protein
MGGHAFQARRAFDLAALTARLKPCPSTTVPIPEFSASCYRVTSSKFPRNPRRRAGPCSHYFRSRTIVSKSATSLKSSGECCINQRVSSTP